MIIALIIVIAIGLAVGLFVLLKIARLPKVQPKKIVLEHTQAVNNHLFTVRQQLHSYVYDILNFYYQGDDSALTVRRQHIADGLNETQKSLDKFVEGYEPYASRSSEAQFTQTASAYHTAAQQFIGQLNEVLEDLPVLHRLITGIRAIAKQAESLSQFVDEDDSAKKTQLNDQLMVVMQACEGLLAGQPEQLKLSQSKTAYDSLHTAIQALRDDYASAKEQLNTDPSQYFNAINAIEPSRLIDSSSFVELFAHLIRDTQLEPYQQAIDQLYFQA